MMFKILSSKKVNQVRAAMIGNINLKHCGHCVVDFNQSHI